MLVGSVRVSYEPPVDDPFVHIRSLRDYRVRNGFNLGTALLMAQNDPSVGPMLNTKIIPLLFHDVPVSIPCGWSTISGFHMHVSKCAFNQCPAQTCLACLSFSPRLGHQNLTHQAKCHNTCASRCSDCSAFPRGKWDSLHFHKKCVHLGHPLVCCFE